MTATVYDLQDASRAGLELRGLSGPNSDGNALFWRPSAPRSELVFRSPPGQFSQYSYQLYSPTDDVTGRVSLNGRVLDQYTFPKGTFLRREVTGVSAPGRNVLTTEYRCGAAACQDVQIHQYWTRLTLAPLPPAAVEAGLNTVRWTPLSLEPQLRSVGLGPLHYGDQGYTRTVEAPRAVLSWPAGAHPLYLKLSLAGNSPFDATVEAAGHVLIRGHGDQANGMSTTVAVAGLRNLRELTLAVSCGEAARCARIQELTLTALPPAALSGFMLLPLVGLLLWSLARLMPLRLRPD